MDFPAQKIRTARRIGDIDLINNPPENQKLLDPDKQSLDKKNEYSWFHMDSAYANPDNIKNAKEKYKSVVEPEEWGNAVGHTPPTHKNRQKSALDWADQAATVFPDTDIRTKSEEHYDDLFACEQGFYRQAISHVVL